MKLFNVNLLVAGIGKVPVTVAATNEFDAVRTALNIVRKTVAADAVAIVSKDGGVA